MLPLVVLCFKCWRANQRKGDRWGEPTSAQRSRGRELYMMRDYQTGGDIYSGVREAAHSLKAWTGVHRSTLQGPGCCGAGVLNQRTALGGRGLARPPAAAAPVGQLSARSRHLGGRTAALLTAAGDWYGAVQRIQPMVMRLASSFFCSVLGTAGWQGRCGRQPNRRLVDGGGGGGGAGGSGGESATALGPQFISCRQSPTQNSGSPGSQPHPPA